VSSPTSWQILATCPGLFQDSDNWDNGRFGLKLSGTIRHPRLTLKGSRKKLWPFEDVEKAEKVFKRHIREKTDPEHSLPRKYKLIHHNKTG